MYNVYLDDTYIRSDNDDIPQINALGGFIIDSEEEDKLIKVIKSEKAKYTDPSMPIKWNFKDNKIKETFYEFKKEDEYKKMLQSSRNIRLNILRKSIDINYQIIFASIKSFSDKKDVIRNKKNEFSQILLENLLFRVGNEAKYSKVKYQIIMDWPPDNNPKPYNRAYYYLLNSDRTISYNRNFCWPHCGEYFKNSIFYCNCSHSPCLQFSDLVVGALKDFIEMSLKGNSKSCVGMEAYKIIESKIRSGTNNKKLGYGIVVPSGNADYKKETIAIFDPKD